MPADGDAPTGPVTQGREKQGTPVDPRLLRYASASRGFFVAIALVGLGQTAAIIGFAALTTRAIVDAVAGAPLTGTLVALAAVVVARALLTWARESVAARAGARVEAQLRHRLLDAIDRLGPGWLAGANSSRLALVAGRGLEALGPYFGRYLPQLVLTALATPILVAMMWWQDWISGLTVLLTLPLIPIFMILIGLATTHVQQRQWQTLARLAARFSDTVNGLSTLTVFGRQHRAGDSIERVTETYRRETMRVLRVSFLSGFALEFLASIAVAIVAVSIGFRLLDGSLPLTIGLFVLLLAPEAYLPLRQVGVQFHASSEGVAATRDVFAVLDAADAAPAASAPATAAGAPELRVTALRVRDLPPVDLFARPGEVVLVEGPSGSGKSSLLAALRGATPYVGSATWRGDEVSALDPSTWLAWAGQHAGLVAGTVGENIALGSVVMPADVVADALVRAQAGELDPGRVLGVQGAGLSGGQAQRVAVARAFARRLHTGAPVIALDEPSAALDATTEAALWREVRRLADDGAVVVLVSHRTSARTIADTVVTLHLPAEVTA
ncbi:thiol reductant ABC exporter subunit CydD [Microbacterium dauci]|uniref:Thiol reductant ABC exporter subunit CydD n=1 Tax=Microbacterium dauci TaxID=3048008 RepID=A0ABT6ZF93_9MICO|nr:thiol reductant ABC exporter subunit CydD [Microbacterium sp. LX3-4]MDJ1114836.1 thiol reductant ABC exporter subunit CydD [Microbacterium sp. LX3-4]